MLRPGPPSPARMALRPRSALSPSRTRPIAQSRCKLRLSCFKPSIAFWYVSRVSWCSTNPYLQQCSQLVIVLKKIPDPPVPHRLFDCMAESFWDPRCVANEVQHCHLQYRTRHIQLVGVEPAFSTPCNKRLCSMISCCQLQMLNRQYCCCGQGHSSIHPSIYPPSPLTRRSQGAQGINVR